MRRHTVEMVCLLLLFLVFSPHADLPARCGANAGNDDNYGKMETLGIGMSRACGHDYWDGEKPTPEKYDNHMLTAHQHSVEPMFLFEYYTRYAMGSGPHRPLGGYDKWFAIGKAFAQRFAPGSAWLESKGITGWGVRTYTALNEPYWSANNWRPYTFREYRDVMKGLADGVHSVDPSLRVLPGGFIPGSFHVCVSRSLDVLEAGAYPIPTGSSSVTVHFDLGLQKPPEGTIRIAMSANFDNGSVFKGAMRCSTNVDQTFQRIRQQWDLPSGATELRKIKIELIQRSAANVKQHSVAFLDNIVVETDKGEVYTEDFEDGESGYIMNRPVITDVGSEPMPRGTDIGARVGRLLLPTHVMHAIADLLNDGTLDGIDLHNYWGDVRDVSSLTEKAQQHLFDKIKADYGITRNIGFYTTEYNADDDDEKKAAKAWMTKFWSVMGVRGAGGEYVVRTGIPFDVFMLRKPSDGFTMTHGMTTSRNPWTPSERGKVYQMLLSLTKGMEFVNTGAVKQGEHLLVGNGRTMWVWHNIANWTDAPGATYEIGGIPGGATKIEVYGWDGKRKTVMTDGTSTISVSGLSEGETYLFIADAHMAVGTVPFRIPVPSKTARPGGPWDEQPEQLFDIRGRRIDVSRGSRSRTAHLPGGVYIGRVEHSLRPFVTLERKECVQ